MRIRTAAYLERSRIPVTIDIGFGDALAPVDQPMTCPSILGMETPMIRTYPPALVIGEKFQAMVALGVINGRMKDYFDLWAIPKAMDIADSDLDAAIEATFARRRTDIPAKRPPGLSDLMLSDAAKQGQWRAYARSIDLEGVTLDEVVEAARALVGPSRARLTAS